MTDHPAVTFLLAAHERAEQLARDAGGDEWERDPHPLCYAVKDSDGDPVVYDEGAPTGEQASHIALHDPASVLRRVEAEREVLAEHAKAKADVDKALAAPDRVHPADAGIFLGRFNALASAVQGLAKAWGWEAGT